MLIFYVMMSIVIFLGILIPAINLIAEGSCKFTKLCGIILAAYIIFLLIAIPISIFK